MLYLSMFYAPVSGLANMLESVQQSMAGAERVMAILDSESEIKNKENAEDLGTAKGAVEFKNVSFSYQEEVPVLKNISFAYTEIIIKIRGYRVCTLYFVTSVNTAISHIKVYILIFFRDIGNTLKA